LGNVEALRGGELPGVGHAKPKAVEAGWTSEW
jgi:hypothetical protein